MVFHVSGTNAAQPAGGGIRVFDAGILSVSGSWYTLPETGNAAPHQTATLYHNSQIPMVRVEVTGGSNTWLYFANIDSDAFNVYTGPDNDLGRFFQQTAGSNKIQFGSRNLWHRASSRS